MDTQNNNLPFKANEVISILQTAPDILARNEASVSACTNAGKTLLDMIEEMEVSARTRSTLRYKNTLRSQRRP